MSSYYYYFMQKMENYQGDLTDIVRAMTSNSGGATSATGDGFSDVVPDWPFPADPANYSSQPIVDDFGDPFSSMRDPLLHELQIPSPVFFNSPTATGFGGGSGGCMVEEEVVKRPCNNIFSRMLQISPNNNTKLPISPPPCELPATILKASPLVPNDVIISSNTSKNCLVVENTTGVHIASPRNPGIKRRKSQAKKVVCIPAPAPANSRPSTGEVVPSDLWAWRKYGQKPIKGSPYPRGYYRCSSSKGCSARKQVERSRTDPNMLVITYTSEHNHPWPTQRNALAGSTRSQPSKTTASSKNSPSQSHKGPTNLKEEERKEREANTETAITPVKEEEMMDDDEEREREIDQMSYRPALPLPDSSSNIQGDDFFADLGEIEADPLNLLFTQGGFSHDHERETTKGGVDPFTSLFDWTGNNNNKTSFGDQAKRGL